jgi:AbrB family looped-hinge helix DNA binding protein
MPLVKVKEKYQVTLPSSVRDKVGLSVGDLLEAEVKGSTITLTPKSTVDRELAIALEEVRKGKTYGPFKTAKEAIRFLHQKAKELKKQPA